MKNSKRTIKSICIFTTTIVLIFLSLNNSYYRSSLSKKEQELKKKNNEIIGLSNEVVFLSASLYNVNKEFSAYKSNTGKLLALKPLESFVSEDEITEIMKEIPTGCPFRFPWVVTAFFGESVGSHGRHRTNHKGWDMIPDPKYGINPEESFILTPFAPGIVEQTLISRVYGKSIYIRHSDRVRTFYSHGEKIYFRSTVGKEVDSDTAIMYMGNTGSVYSSTGNGGHHLHFELQVLVKEGMWVSIDPKPFMVQPVM